MNKRRATVLYTLYALLLTLVLIFGFSLSRLIIDRLVEMTHDGSVTDVRVNLKESYIPGKSYSPSYVAKGDFGADAKLRFEALDNTLTVDKTTGTVKGTVTDRQSSEGRVRITSLFDTTFEKIITFKFKKKYPTSLETKYVSPSVGYDSSILYTGVPVYIYFKLPTDSDYSKDGYTLIYDEEYFTLREDGALIPIKSTSGSKKLSFTYRTPEGVEAVSKSFKISGGGTVTDFDEISLYKMGNKPEGIVGSSYFIFLLKDGKRVHTDYTLTYDKKYIIKSSTYSLSYKKSGDTTLTVTLPNGFSRSIDIHADNVMCYPDFGNMADGDGVIKLYQNKSVSFNYSYETGTTYRSLKLDYNSDAVKITDSGSTLLFTGKKLGDYKLTVAVDDGQERLEHTYTVRVMLHDNLADLIKFNSTIFVSKYLGHLCGFGMLAIFAVNMFRFFERRRRVLTVLAYLGCAGVIAVLTEFCQYFIPKRTASVEDMGIDMASYLLGTVVALIIFGISGAIKEARARRRLKERKAMYHLIGSPKKVKKVTRLRINPRKRVTKGEEMKRKYVFIYHLLVTMGTAIGGAWSFIEATVLTSKEYEGWDGLGAGIGAAILIIFGALLLLCTILSITPTLISLKAIKKEKKRYYITDIIFEFIFLILYVIALVSLFSVPAALIIIPMILLNTGATVFNFMALRDV